jgi:hypothetical protein
VSIDTRGRMAADGLREAASPIDGGTMLRAMHDLRRRRNRGTVLAGVMAAVVVVSVVVVAIRPAAQNTEPGGRPTAGNGCPAPFAGVRPPAFGYQLAGLTCLGGRTFRADMSTPLTFELPPTFAVDIAASEVRTHLSLNQPRSGVPDHDWTAVLVTERAVALRPKLVGDLGAGGHWQAVVDPSAGTSPQSVARWLTKRSFVAAATVTPTTVSGYPAYRVDLTGSGTPAPGGGPEIPVLTDIAADPSGLFTVWPRLHVRVWLFDLPGTGLAMVWSQSPRNPADLDVADAVVDSLRFTR